VKPARASPSPHPNTPALTAPTDTAPDLDRRVSDLADGAWALAALSTALEHGLLEGEPAGAADIARRTGLAEPLVARLLDVLVALGFVERRADGTYRAAAGLADRGVAERLGAEARSTLLQAAELGRGGPLDREGWRHEDPALLHAQGVSSSAAVPALAAAFPSLGDLAERMDRPGAAALDVGTGVAAIAIALCRRFPALRVVGLEPAKAPMAEARRNVVAAGLDRRIELRGQRVEDLADEAAFDFAFLPLVFLSTATLRAGLPAVHRALKPGGWVVTAALGAAGDALAPALARLKGTLWGSEALAPHEVRALLEEAGYVDVREIDVPAGATLLPVAARRD
jgi:predicted O-methyltransferase YrrM/DNA-binding transcriptional ArsR family regulator